MKYDGQLVGTLIPNLIVDQNVMVDTKIADAFNESHTAQMLGYLAITELRLALLISFKSQKLKWKRVVR